jgi:Tfp pilus assembly protein PilF/ketosteroid isomerase-like protein
MGTAGLWLVLALPGWSMATVPASAAAVPQRLQAATQALQSGATEEAQQLLSSLHQQAPEDVRVRFLQGVLQAQQGRVDQAIASFRAITRSHPHLSEPHNNLGVLLAARGQLAEARTAFERALHTHPSFAAAHRNLLDVQGQMAQQSFARALMTETGRSVRSPALTLLATLDPSVRSGPEDVAAAAAAPVPAQARTPTAAPPASAVQSPAAAPSSPAAPAQPPQAFASAATASAAARSASAMPPRPSASAPAPMNADAPVAALRQSLQAWASAWSRQDMRDYLDSYADDFEPPAGMRRAQWEADRRLKITSKRKIAVDILQLEVQVRGSTATTRFRQLYTSDSLKVSSRKTLQWVWREGRWRIRSETTG